MAKKSRRRKKVNKPTNYREGKLDTSRPDSKPALIALLLVVILIGSGLYLTSMVDTEETVTNPTYGVEAEFITNNHNADPGGETDFVLLVRNTGSITDTFTISVKSNDGNFVIDIEDGFETIILAKGSHKPLLINVKTSTAAEGLLYAHMEVTSGGDPTKSTDVRMDINTDYEFGNQTEVGDGANVHYAGILASDGRLFDGSMKAVWDLYEKSGHYSQLPQDDPSKWTSDQSRHVGTLGADNIGCNSSGNPSDKCNGSREMIKGFDTKMVGMYEGQTLAVRIPAKDAYGETGGSHLAGQDLIFIIEMVSIN